jgi:hypothetical protein
MRHEHRGRVAVAHGHEASPIDKDGAPRRARSCARAASHRGASEDAMNETAPGEA